MKKNVGVWLDYQKAFIVTLSNGQEIVHKLDSKIESRIRFTGETKEYTRMGTQFYDTEKRHDERRKKQINAYCDKIIKNISDASNLYILGPAEAKVCLEKEIKKRKDISAKISRVEPTESKLTERQIIAKIKKHFA